MKNEHEKKQIRAKPRDDSPLVREAADAATPFLEAVDNAVRGEGLPKNALRSKWAEWNLCDVNGDAFRNREGMETECQLARVEMAQVEGVKVGSDKYLQKLETLMPFHLLLIMAISMGSTDEKTRENYLSIAHIALSPKQFLLPLSRVSFLTYFTFLGKLLEHVCGMHHLRAEIVLWLTAVIQCKYSGITPHNADVLGAIDHLGKKKIGVFLHARGLYTVSNVGPGVDRHVRKCLVHFLKKRGVHGSETFMQQRVEEMGQWIPRNPGLRTK